MKRKKIKRDLMKIYQSSGEEGAAKKTNTMQDFLSHIKLTLLRGSQEVVLCSMKSVQMIQI